MLEERFDVPRGLVERFPILDSEKMALIDGTVPQRCLIPTLNSTVLGFSSPTPHKFWAGFKQCFRRLLRLKDTFWGEHPPPEYITLEAHPIYCDTVADQTLREYEILKVEPLIEREEMAEVQRFFEHEIIYGRRVFTPREDMLLPESTGYWTGKDGLVEIAKKSGTVIHRLMRIESLHELRNILARQGGFSNLIALADLDTFDWLTRDPDCQGHLRQTPIEIIPNPIAEKPSIILFYPQAFIVGWWGFKRKVEKGSIGGVQRSRTTLRADFKPTMLRDGKALGVAVLEMEDKDVPADSQLSTLR